MLHVCNIAEYIHGIYVALKISAVGCDLRPIQRSYGLAGTKRILFISIVAPVAPVGHAAVGLLRAVG